MQIKIKHKFLIRKCGLLISQMKILVKLIQLYFSNVQQTEEIKKKKKIKND